MAAVRSAWRATLAGALMLLSAISAGAQQAVELELVLAVDVSMSMDSDEIALQRRGYLEAFRSPDVVDAILTTGTGKIAVAYMEWAGIQHARFAVPWFLIDSRESAAEFVRRLEVDMPSRIDRTSISAAMVSAYYALRDNEYEGRRKVIDISGDGPNNEGEPLPGLRDTMLEDGVTINGLAIMVNPGSRSLGIDNLDEYYRNCVTGGSSSFVLSVRDWSQFARAIRYKLLQEITGAEPPARLIAAAEAPVDCEVGEKIWRNFIQLYGPQSVK